MELIDGGEQPENVQCDTDLGASKTTRADQEIVDVTLSGRVSTLLFLFLFPFPSS